MENNEIFSIHGLSQVFLPNNKMRGNQSTIVRICSLLKTKKVHIKPNVMENSSPIIWTLQFLLIYSKISSSSLDLKKYIIIFYPE